MIVRSVEYVSPTEPSFIIYSILKMRFFQNHDLILKVK